MAIVPLALVRDDSLGAAAVRAYRRTLPAGIFEPALRPNLSEAAQRYLDNLGASAEDLIYNVLAVLHDPVYRDANAGALRMEWPRIPLPGWPDGNAKGAAEALARVAARGGEIASLLDADQAVPGVTLPAIRPEIAVLAMPATTTGRQMAGDDFAVTAGWGHHGAGNAVMPSQGRAHQREYTAEERAGMGEVVSVLGDTTLDIYLNCDAFWRNVPVAVWNYKLGGYQVLKKWLSYREFSVLDRPLHADEVLYFSETARRIGALLLLLRKQDMSVRE